LLHEIEFEVGTEASEVSGFSAGRARAVPKKEIASKPRRRIVKEKFERRVSSMGMDYGIVV
jgi:hypothetical protein